MNHISWSVHLPGEAGGQVLLPSPEERNIHSAQRGLTAPSRHSAHKKWSWGLAVQVDSTAYTAPAAERHRWPQSNGQRIQDKSKHLRGGCRGAAAAGCKICYCCCLVAQLLMFSSFVAPWMAACQAPLSMGFSRQEYCNGLSFPPPKDLLDRPRDPTHVSCGSCIASRFFTEPPAKPIMDGYNIKYYMISLVCGT